MKFIKIPIVIASFIITSLSMVSGEEAPKQLITETSWNLVGWTDKGEIAKNLEHLPTIRFTKDGQVSGNGGANGFDGKYSAKAGGALKLGDLMGTEMGGPRDVLMMEQAYFRLLSKVTQWSIVDETLILSDGTEKNQLRYKIKADKVVRELKGQPWTLLGVQTVQGDAAVLTALGRGGITLKIGKDDQVTGHGGVNRYTSKAEIKGDQISIGPVASTKMAGPAQDMAAEGQFFEKLESISRWEINGSQLTLSDEKQTFGLVFEAFDEPG